jgi:hypothetical protein
MVTIIVERDLGEVGRSRVRSPDGGSPDGEIGGSCDIPGGSVDRLGCAEAVQITLVLS